MVLVENLGEKSREDDIGIGASQVVAHQFRMLVEESLPATTVVGQHYAFLQLPPHGDANDRRQESPARAAVDMQHIIMSRSRKQANWH